MSELIERLKAAGNELAGFDGSGGLYHEAAERIAELEQLFVDCVDPMELYPEGEKLWNEIHKRLYPENYGGSDENI